jgi:hypothetical protein
MKASFSGYRQIAEQVGGTEGAIRTVQPSTLHRQTETVGAKVHETSAPLQVDRNASGYGATVTRLSRNRSRARNAGRLGVSWWIGPSREQFARIVARRQRQREQTPPAVQAYLRRHPVVRVCLPDVPSIATTECFRRGYGWRA